MEYQYPEGTSDRLTLHWTEQLPADCRILMTTVSGESLRLFKVPTGATQLEILMDNLPAGLYFLRLEEQGKTLGIIKVARF